MTENKHENPRVFISYSWDSPEHKLWVESFARELRKAGIDARLDAWRDESQSIDDFMMIELERADYVVAICTPQFKQKIVENAEGVAGTASGFEIGTAAALRRSSGKDVIPVLRAGTWLESAPSFLVSYRFYDFTQDDVSVEFEQLRDRLLGHVRRPPELGTPASPAAGPELPDIFAKGSKPEPVTGSAPPPADQPRAAPPPAAQSAPTPAAPAPAPSGGGKKWVWALGGAAAVIVLLLLIPTDENPEGPAQAQPQGFSSPQGSSSDNGGFEPDFVAQEQSAGDLSIAESMPEERSEIIDPATGWGIVSDATGCSVLRQLASSTWLQMAYDAAKDVFVLSVYDPAWRQVEVGKIYEVVLELDDNENLAYPGDAYGLMDDGIPGAYVEFTNIEFLQGLSERHLLSFYWAEEPYREYWVMDAELTGSSLAVQSLVECTTEFAGP